MSLSIGRCCTQETVRVSKAFSVGILYMQMHLSVASTSVSVLLYIGEEVRAEQSKAGLAPPPHSAGACPSTLSWGSREEETASAFPSHCMGLDWSDHPEKMKPKAGEMEGFYLFLVKRALCWIRSERRCGKNVMITFLNEWKNWIEIHLSKTIYRDVHMLS